MTDERRGAISGHRGGSTRFGMKRSSYSPGGETRFLGVARPICNLTVSERSKLRKTATKPLEFGCQNRST
jgi:hypothetical protein